MYRILKRYSMVVLAAGYLVSASAHAEEQHLKVQYYGGIVHELTLYVAVAEGIFKKHGLDVELVSMNSGPAALAALSGGSVDIAVGNPDIMITGLQGGLDLKAVCAGSGPFFEMVGTSAFSPGPYPEVMKQVVGKKMGVTALGASGQFFADALLEGAGLPKDSLNYVAVGTLTAVEAMQNRRIDLYMSFEPVTTLLIDTTGAKLLWTLASGQGPELLTKLGVGLIWFTKTDNLTKNPAPYQAFARSLEEAKTFASNPSNANKVADDVIKLAGVNTKTLPHGDDSLRDVIKNKLLRVHAVSAFTADEAAAWLRYMQKYTRDVLKGAYANQDPRQIMADKVWPQGCK